MAFLEDWNFREEEFLKNLCMTLSGSNCIGNDDVADNLRSPKAVASECGGEIFYESIGWSLERNAKCQFIYQGDFNSSKPTNLLLGHLDMSSSTAIDRLQCTSAHSVLKSGLYTVTDTRWVFVSPC